MKRAIAWFARNGVAANLLMLFVVFAGGVTSFRIKEEVFPEFSSDMITVEVRYLGAAPEEVEEGVCVRIEEALQGLPDIKRITSQAVEGLGTVAIELQPGAEARSILDEVKARVDQIDTFPEETEKPVVREVILRRQVINVAVAADTDRLTLRRLAERVRDEIAALPGVSLVEIANAPPYEISIEVSEEELRRRLLTFDEVAAAVRRFSLDLPGGTIKTRGGEILLRAKGQSYRAEDFARIPVITNSDGTRVVLGDVARIRDGFEDTDQFSTFDGKPTYLIQVFRVGEQGALDVAEAVHGYVAEARKRLPEGVTLTTWQDDSAVLASRLDLLKRNAFWGLVLVFILLALFLRFRLAFWVAVGIPVSFLGALWLLPAMGISINLVSLFAFIVVLGIVVDDAIVVAENVYSKTQSGLRGVEASVAGAVEVAKPVTFSVLTTIAAFVPLLTVEGNMGKVMRVIPAVVIAALIFSLLESLFVLPRHLSHLPPPQPRRGGTLRSASGVFQRLLRGFTDRVYHPFLDAALGWRYLTLALGVASLVLTVAFVAGGRLKFVFFPPVDADNVVAFVTMPQGTPAEVTAQAVARLEEAAARVREELRRRPEAGGNDLFRHVLASVGGQPFREAQNLRRGRSRVFSGAHLGEVNVELIPSEERRISSSEIAKLWRAAVGPIPGAIEVAFTSSLFSTGEAINVELAHDDLGALRAAAERLKKVLARYDGVFDITDNFRAGKEEILVDLRPGAELSGYALSSVARQVRQAFYGEEAQRVQRGRDDVRVMVRYPEAARKTLGTLDEMRVRLEPGVEAPLGTVARVRRTRGYAAIQRADRRRVVNVTADLDPRRANANEILAEVTAAELPELASEYPGLTWSLEGEQREQRETLRGLERSFAIAVFLIYVLLAIPFRSYVQPFLVMSAIPFGLVGAVWGHVLMGKELTLLSMFGLVALAGVIVNDSLVLVDYVNRLRERGVDLRRAVHEAGLARFRPILLTSLTTFAGLTPLLLERSLQAQFLIPMAISLGFGVLFGTVISLVLVPVGYLVLEDLKRLTGLSHRS